MKSVSKTVLSVSLVVLTTSTSLAAFSTFDTGTQGWGVISFANVTVNNFSIIGTYSPTFVSVAGNPGGYIFTGDPDSGDYAFSAPSEYLGNQSSSIGATITYDLTHTGEINLQGADVILEGGGLRLVWQSNPELLPTEAWQTVSFVLGPTPGWHVSAMDGAAATTADFENVLANVTGFYIRGEYTFGSESAGLDNVRFDSVPEPKSAAAAFLCFGFGLLSIRQLKRHNTRYAS